MSSTPEESEELSGSSKSDRDAGGRLIFGGLPILFGRTLRLAGCTPAMGKRWVCEADEVARRARNADFGQVEKLTGPEPW